MNDPMTTTSAGTDPVMTTSAGTSQRFSASSGSQRSSSSSTGSQRKIQFDVQVKLYMVGDSGRSSLISLYCVSWLVLNRRRKDLLNVKVFEWNF
jgi:hypothetical protein